MPTFYVFGSRIFEGDNIAINMADELRKKFPQHDFVLADVEDLPFGAEKLNIIDVAKGIKEVMLLSENDLHIIKDVPRVSVHDFDLSVNLKIMVQAGIIKHVNIIAVPFCKDASNSRMKKFFEEVCKIISSFSWES